MFVITAIFTVYTCLVSFFLKLEIIDLSTCFVAIYLFAVEFDNEASDSADKFRILLFWVMITLLFDIIAFQNLMTALISILMKILMSFAYWRTSLDFP
jgi:hypothetical protein